MKWSNNFSLALLSLVLLSFACNYVDEIPPVMTLKGDNPQHLYLDETYQEEGVFIWDNVDGEITTYTVLPTSIPNGVPGTYTLDYSCQDAEGNEATATRTVVIDPEPYELPTVLPGTYSVSVDSGFPYLYPSQTSIYVQNQWAGSRNAFVEIFPFPAQGGVLAFVGAGVELTEINPDGVWVHFGSGQNDYFLAYVSGGGVVDLQTNTLVLDLLFLSSDTTRGQFKGRFTFQKI